MKDVDDSWSPNDLLEQMILNLRKCDGDDGDDDDDDDNEKKVEAVAPLCCHTLSAPLKLELNFLTRLASQHGGQ